jgi:hypothetical protein
MTRRRFIQMREPPYTFVEVGEDYIADPGRVSDAALWGDRYYDGLQATDGADISTRTKHLEYMKRNGLTTVDDYGAAHWDRYERARQDVREGKDPQRKLDIARAIATLERRQRR